MQYLIDEATQGGIAEQIDLAVAEVLTQLPNHGSEEGLTPVLGHALMRQGLHSPTLRVDFNYRQLNKYTEEPNAGADGGFLVKVTTPSGSVEKAALFQAKLMKGDGAIRQLSMRAGEAQRLKSQSADMLAITEEAVAIFYTQTQIYVVDAEHYRASKIAAVQYPLSEDHRLITLGTYLGRWLPRCTRGDKDAKLLTRVKHLDGFKHGLTMNVITNRPSIAWRDDPTAKSWRSSRPHGRK